jgi:hypothetical protein
MLGGTMIEYIEFFERDIHRSEEKSKVYIISEDEDYNNYDIRKVFFDKEKAEEFMVGKNKNNWKCEEFEVE